MLGFDPEGLKEILREVLQVLGDDDLRVATDGCGEDAAVVGIWQDETLDERLMPGDETVGDRFAHQLSGPLELFRSEVRTTLEDATDHLIEDLIAPPRSEEAGLCEPDQ